MINPVISKGQLSLSNSEMNKSYIHASIDLLFNRISVYQYKGKAIHGFLAGVNDDSLFVRVQENDSGILFSNLAKVVIETEIDKKSNSLNMMLIGIYLGNILFSNAENQPTRYAEKIYSSRNFIINNLLFATAGYMLGYLSSHLNRTEKTFDYTSHEQAKELEWERMKHFITGRKVQRKVHISFQSGLVFRQVTKKYQKLLQDLNYYQGNYYWDYSDHAETVNFNWLRAIRLTISHKQIFEMGFAYYLLGEPSISGYNELAGDYYDVNVQQDLYTKGYYVLGIYQPFYNRLPKKISWKAGMGLGIAEPKFKLSANLYTGYPQYKHILINHEIKNPLFTCLFITEFNLYILNATSIGLVADYAFITPRNVPGIPEAGIPSQRLWLGNGSIGLSLDFHF